MSEIIKGSRVRVIVNPHSGDPLYDGLYLQEGYVRDIRATGKFGMLYTITFSGITWPFFKNEIVLVDERSNQ